MGKQMLLFGPGRRRRQSVAGPVHGDGLTHREIVLALFRGAGARGLTRDQVCAVTGWHPGQVTPRVVELVHDGLIEVTNRMRETRCKKLARVLVIKLERTAGSCAAIQVDG